jgi:uncharacterized membrane protein YagU involved in acid resistance
MSTSTTAQPLNATVTRGAVSGMIAGAVMAMFAMVASVAYQDHGFFTPLFHISALFGSPDAMMRSVAEAMARNRFWLTAGPAVLGLVIHMMTGAMFGIGFAFLARRLPRAALVPAGALYGLAVFVMSAFVGLPVAAKVTGSGTTISDMASMVGWVTFAAEHVMFGLVLGALALRTAPADGTTDAVVGARSAMLSR